MKQQSTSSKHLLLKSFMILLFLTLTNCQKDDTIILQEAKVKFTAPSIFDAKNNFLQKSTLNVKDVNAILQSRDLQTSLTVDWELSKTKKYKDEPNQEVDILYTPIYINNDAQAKMFIGSVEHNGVVESNLFCLIYTDTENTTSFSGYFLRFNLDGILLDAKKYNNGVIIEPSNQSGGSLGRSSNSECTDFSQLLECLLDYFGGDLDLSFWHLGGLLDQVVVTASIDAGPSGSGGTDSSLTSPFNIPYIDNDISSTGGSSSIELSWWSTSHVTANPFNILQWLEIHPITPQGQFLLNEASSNLLQDIANFLNDNMYRIRDEFPDLDGFDPVNNNNANTGYAISEEAIEDVIEAIDTLALEVCLSSFVFTDVGTDEEEESNWQNAGLSNVNVQFLTIGSTLGFVNVNFPELHFGLPKLLLNGDYITNHNARYKAKSIMNQAEHLTSVYQSINPSVTPVQLKAYFLQKLQQISANFGGTVGTSAPLGWNGELVPHQTNFIFDDPFCD